MTIRKSAESKVHNISLADCLQSYCPLKNKYYKFCPEHNSWTAQCIDLKLNGKIDGNDGKCRRQRYTAIPQNEVFCMSPIQIHEITILTRKLFVPVTWILTWVAPKSNHILFIETSYQPTRFGTPMYVKLAFRNYLIYCIIALHNTQVIIKAIPIG